MFNQRMTRYLIQERSHFF